MKLNHAVKFKGITGVYTHKKSHPTYAAYAKKKPYIQFVSPAAYSGCNSWDKLSSLGCVADHNNSQIITITSIRQIDVALGVLFADDDYAHNKHVIRQLKSFRSTLKIKRLAPPPAQSINYSDLLVGSLLETQGISHLAYNARYGSEDYVFKSYSEGRKITELEVYFSYCYRLLLGQQTPRMYSVHDKNRAYRGVVSKFIPKFVTLTQHTEEGDELDPAIQKQCIEGGLGRIMAASFCEKEFDLNCGNVGLDENGVLHKIDHDFSGWNISCRYHMQDSTHVCFFGTSLNEVVEFPPPKYSFRATSKDLELLPHFNSVKPFNFLTKYFDDLASNHVFQRDKWMTLLKFIVIPEQTYLQIGEQTIRNCKFREQLFDDKLARIAEMRSVLLQCAEFQKFLAETTELKSLLLEEFRQYNALYPSEPLFQVKLSEVEKNFDWIVKSQEEKVAAIKKRLPSFKNKVGLLGGERKELDRHSVLLPVGVSEMMDATNDEQDPLVQLLSAQEIAQKRLRQPQHWFFSAFNRRSDETQTFYQCVSLLSHI